MKRLGDLMLMSSDCHLFNGANTYKHMGFESDVAVLHGMCRESVLYFDVK